MKISSTRNTLFPLPSHRHVCAKCAKEVWTHRNCHETDHYCGGKLLFDKEYTQQEAMDMGANIVSASRPSGGN